MKTSDAAVSSTYDAFAPAYDAFTAHHRLDDWLQAVEGLALEEGLSGRRVLDVGCGTGNSFLPLLRRGYRVVGCDVSDGMLEVARSKAAGRAELLWADMRDLPVLGEFDLVTCLDDAVNYLDRAEELELVFAGVAKNLAPAGVFVFDVNTLKTYRTTFAGDQCWEREGGFFAWRGQSSTNAPAGVAARARLEAFLVRGATWERISTDHVQRHFDHDSVVSALSRAALRVAAVRGHSDDGTQHESHDELRDTKRIYAVVHKS